MSRFAVTGSQPFVGGGDPLRVIQLCRRDTPRFQSYIKPAQTLTYSLSPNYVFVVDVFTPSLKDSELVYTQKEKKVIVKHARSPAMAETPIIGCISGLDVLNQQPPPDLTGVNVLFHLGDLVAAESCFWKKDMDTLAQIYIDTWNELPMSAMEHRLIPDDSDFASDTLLHAAPTRGGKLDFSQMTKFMDVMVEVINGAPRKPEHYYTTRLETKTTLYLAISNWVPDAQLQPRFANNTTLVEDLLRQYPVMGKDVVLLLSRCAFALIQTLRLSQLRYENEYKWNVASYTAFAKLQRTWGVKCTIVCGDIGVPVAFQVQVGGSSFAMYGTGMFSRKVEEHRPDDFLLPKHSGVTLRALPHCHHLEPGHSYLRIRNSKAFVMYDDQDPLHSMSELISYIINGLF